MTFTTAALRPAKAPREGSAAAVFSAFKLESLFTNSWLYPKRTALTKFGVKVWVSSAATICLDDKVFSSTFPMESGEL